MTKDQLFIRLVMIRSRIWVYLSQQIFPHELTVSDFSVAKLVGVILSYFHDGMLSIKRSRNFHRGEVSISTH